MDSTHLIQEVGIRATIKKKSGTLRVATPKSKMQSRVTLDRRHVYVNFGDQHGNDGVAVPEKKEVWAVNNNVFTKRQVTPTRT